LGIAIDRLEPYFRKLPLGLVSVGACFAIVLISGTWAATVLLLHVADSIHPLFSLIIEIVLLFYCLSAQSLASAAQAVLVPLKQNDIKSAKTALAMIVGRDVRGLSRQGVIRATIETISENLVDGVLSPLFYAAIGGAPLAMAFKMTNTLDSMVGYKNEKYEAFGKASARLDDLANFLPARLSVLIIALSARFLMGRCSQAFQTGLQEGRLHSSPNAGYPEAAFAGALQVKLGGPNYYHGKLVNKPFIGRAYGPASSEDITRACHLMHLAAFIGMLLACLFAWI
jgi:adenosylcobinamide-phosphate synthase